MTHDDCLRAAADDNISIAKFEEMTHEQELLHLSGQCRSDDCFICEIETAHAEGRIQELMDKTNENCVRELRRIDQEERDAQQG